VVDMFCAKFLRQIDQVGVGHINLLT